MRRERTWLRREPYAVHRRPRHRVGRGPHHPQNAGTRSWERGPTRMDERAMACRTSRLALTVRGWSRSLEYLLRELEVWMALMFHRRLAIPLWAIAFFTIALAAPAPATLLRMPPTTLFAIALAGIAVLVFAMQGAFPWLPTSHSLARVIPSRHRDEASSGSAIDGGTCARTPDDPNWHTAEDALDLVRMDDDGGWQMARPPAYPTPSGPRDGNRRRAR
jgi:hypothetical protein